MLLIMSILLGIVAAVVELRTALGIRFIRTLIEKSAVIGVGFSVLLSLLIGSIFGAAGLVVMLGALIAVTITQPVYAVMGKVKKTGIDVKQTAHEVKSMFDPFIGFIKFALFVMFLPFIVIFKVMRWNANRKSAHTVAA